MGTVSAEPGKLQRSPSAGVAEHGVDADGSSVAEACRVRVDRQHTRVTLADLTMSGSRDTRALHLIPRRAARRAGAYFGRAAIRCSTVSGRVHMTVEPWPMQLKSSLPRPSHDRALMCNTAV